MKVNKDKFEALFRKLLEQKPSKRESLKTGEKKKSATMAPTWNRPMKVEVTQLISPSFFDFFFKISRD